MKTVSSHPSHANKPFSLSFARLGLFTGILLLIPVFGNLFIDGWVWGPLDFVFAAVMIFGFGSLYILVSRKLQAPAQRAVLAAILVFLFLVIWAEMAVDFIEQIF